MFSAERIKAILERELPECTAEVVDPANDGMHFAARVVSSAFDGESRIQQHRLVYGALGDHMKEDIHALQLQTFTPSQWREQGE